MCVCVYTHGILFSHKKEEILPFETMWINIKEISQIQRDKYYIISLTHRLFSFKKKKGKL